MEVYNWMRSLLDIVIDMRCFMMAFQLILAAVCSAPNHEPESRMNRVFILANISYSDRFEDSLCCQDAINLLLFCSADPFMVSRYDSW